MRGEEGGTCDPKGTFGDNEEEARGVVGKMEGKSRCPKTLRIKRPYKTEDKGLSGTRRGEGSGNNRVTLGDSGGAGVAVVVTRIFHVLYS